MSAIKRIEENDGNSIEAYDDYIILTYKPIIGPKKEKRIYYASVSSVQYKKNLMLGGSLQFNVTGDSTKNQSDCHSLIECFENNIYLYTSAKLHNSVEAFKDIVDEKILECIKIKNSPTVSTTISQFSSADELLKFKSLLDSGIISQEEFDFKKKELIGMPKSISVTTKTEEKGSKTEEVMGDNNKEATQIAQFESRALDNIICPNCQKPQRSNRDNCFRCGTKFVYMDE